MIFSSCKNKISIHRRMTSIKNFNWNSKSILDKWSKFKILSCKPFKKTTIFKTSKFKYLFNEKRTKILLRVSSKKRNKINSLSIKLLKSSQNKLKRLKKYINKGLRKTFSIMNNFCLKKLNKIKECFNLYLTKRNSKKI